MSASPARDAVFLDRDGTIIVDKDYLSDPDGVEFERGAIAGLQRLVASGFRLVGITNQSGIGRGMFDMAAVDRVNDRVSELLRAHDIMIKHWYVCPHVEGDGCSCRKPAPGLIEAAVRDLDIDLTQSFIIGDKLSDVELEQTTGAKAILVGTGKGHALQATARARGYHVADDLAAAAEIIAGLST